MTLPTWPDIPAIAYGGDYNPDQWPRETWYEDVALMRQAGVNLVSIGMFSWAQMERSEGVFEFGWLDEVLDLLHANGIAVDLGTPTAAPPAWFYAAHPESRIVTREGMTVGFGSRGMPSHASAAYREAIERIADALAARYKHHPAVVMWHIHNEYGVPSAEDYSEAATRAFRTWLRRRYGTLDALNAAWGTAVWSQTCHEWDHVPAPAVSGQAVNPAHRVDYARFTDEALRECYRIERDAIRRHSDKPITTNFMTNSSWETDLWAWAQEVDIVSDDHYLDAADPAPHIGLALAADLNRSLGKGAPWILMEHSTSAVNWQDRNVAKRPGEMARNSLTHLARGADAILFFQWRAARHGAEKFHSTMLPHAGTRGRVWAEVTALGAALRNLAPVTGSRVHAEVAILLDFESIWAQRLEWRPSIDHTAKERIRAFYEACWRAGVTVDFAHPAGDLSGYRMVIAPAQYMLRQADAENLNSYVEGGGTLVVSYFSAIVDENDAVQTGGFLAPLEPALGLAVDEFLPFRAAETASVTWDDGEGFATEVWQESLLVGSAQTRATNASGPGAGGPAVTRNSYGRGVGWYVATRLGQAGLSRVLAAAFADAGVRVPNWPEGVEVVTRHGDSARFTFAINHADLPARVRLTGTDLLTGTAVDGEWTLPAGAVAVVAEAAGK